MVGNSPRFWWSSQKFMRHLLFPFSIIYGYFADRTMKRKNVPSVSMPVLCVGNFTLGGTGKTPVVIALTNTAKRLGLKPGIVSRGYGGKIKHSRCVDLARDKARDVGDEPILLAQHATVAVGTDRIQSAKLLQNEGCNFILMDDGFQSRRMVIDFAVLVIDGLRGLGNGAVFPAGPLRAPLKTQLAYANSLIMIGTGDRSHEIPQLAKQADKPLTHARLTPLVKDNVKGKSFLAFAGIGNPEKFFCSIRELQGKVVKTMVYADHHFFTDRDLDDINNAANNNNLFIATTAKDFVRIKGDKKDKLLEKLYVFDVEVAFDDPDFCESIINDTLDRFKNRTLNS